MFVKTYTYNVRSMMKKPIVMCIALLLVGSLLGVAFWFTDEGGVRDDILTSFAYGSGTLENPYMIENVYQLQAMRDDLNAHYALANDIDANETSEWNDGAGFEPVGDDGGRFKGSFNGHNYTITGLYISRTTDYTGLFGYVGETGYISNVFLANISLNGELHVGGLVGWNLGSIVNAHVSGEVYGIWNTGGVVGTNGDFSLNYASVSNTSSTAIVGGEQRVGGVVGWNSKTLEYSYATGDVMGVTHVGGFMGLHSYGLIKDSYSLGTVTRIYGSSNSLGGFIGWNNEGKIINCYSTGQVVYEGNVTNPTDKGFAGTVHYGGNYEMSRNFWNIETSGQTETAGNATGKTTQEMMTQGTFTDVGWDFYNIWWIIEDENYPQLFWQRKSIFLTITIEGEGFTDPGEGQHTYKYGTLVTVTSLPEQGWYFSHWSGDVPDGQETNENITIIMDGNKTVTAHFEQIYHNLTLSVIGEGGTDPPVGNHTYAYGTLVNMTAKPSTGWRFSHWSGDVPEGNETNENITIVMDGDKNITAHFEELLFLPDNFVLLVNPVEGTAPLEVTITVGARNTGLLDGYIDLVVDGTVIHTLVIPANGTAGHNLTHTFANAGTFEIVFEEKSESVTVHEAEEDDDTGLLWLILFAAAVVILLAAVFFWMKKKPVNEDETLTEEENELSTPEGEEMLTEATDS